MVFSRIVCGIVYAFFIIFVIVDVVISKTYYNLISAAGIVIYVLGFFIFSKHPSKVNETNSEKLEKWMKQTQRSKRNK